MSLTFESFLFQALAACTKACQDVLASVQCPGAARVISEGGEWSGMVGGGGATAARELLIVADMHRSLSH
jgi:predicted Fe-S protein YdhL (DUF1289 family)